MSAIPKSRPKQSREETAGILSRYGVDVTKHVALLGVRGYYKDSMGKKGANDINVYDDALFVISPDTYKSFNFNTDPAKAGHNLAMLVPGVYDFYKGKHKGKYNALRPYPEGVRLPCTRDGVKSLCGATNIHKGGVNSTWSEGCQTIPETQFGEAMPLIYAQMTKYGQKTIQYVLIDATKTLAAASTAHSGKTPSATTGSNLKPATDEAAIQPPPIDPNGQPDPPVDTRESTSVLTKLDAVGDKVQSISATAEKFQTISTPAGLGTKLSVFWKQVILPILMMFWGWISGHWEICLAVTVLMVAFGTYEWIENRKRNNPVGAVPPVAPPSVPGIWTRVRAVFKPSLLTPPVVVPDPNADAQAQEA